MSLQLTTTETKQELDQKLVAFIAAALEKGISERGFASLLVSGGSTPKPMFQALSKVEINWSAVVVTLVDERCVPESDDQSNARLVRENLLQNAAAAAQYEPTFVVGEGIEACRSRFKAHPVLSQTYDVVILGMGGDAHTASIFPEAAERDAALDLANNDFMIETDPVTVTPMRYTLTRSKLLDTRNLLLHIVGEGKMDVFKKAQIAQNPEMPISYFVHQDRIPLSVFFAKG